MRKDFENGLFQVGSFYPVMGKGNIYIMSRTEHYAIVSGAFSGKKRIWKDRLFSWKEYMAFEASDIDSTFPKNNRLYCVADNRVEHITERNMVLDILYSISGYHTLPRDEKNKWYDAMMAAWRSDDSEEKIVMLMTEISGEIRKSIRERNEKRYERKGA